MTFTKEQAKASDRVLAELTQAFYVAQTRIDAASHKAHVAAGDQKAYIGRTAVWRLSEEDVEARLEGRARTAEYASLREDASTALNLLHAVHDILRDAQWAMDAHNVEWSMNGRWSRFYLVPGGHIHRNPGCHSLRPTTHITWLPELSGESDADAVKEHGPLLCTFCFPDAPVEWTNGEKAPDATVCTGSGKYVGNTMTDKEKRLYRKYTACPECGLSQSVTSAYKIRKHKKAKSA